MKVLAENIKIGDKITWPDSIDANISHIYTVESVGWSQGITLSYIFTIVRKVDDATVERRNIAVESGGYVDLIESSGQSQGELPLDPTPTDLPASDGSTETSNPAPAQ